MPISIQRPSGVNVGVLNPGDTIYLQGSESVDGSLRLITVDFEGSEVTEIQKRTSGIWAGTSFKTGPNSVIVGTVISLSAAGNSLITVDQQEGAHFHVRSRVQNGVTTKLSSIIFASDFFEEVVFFPDVDGEFTGTLIEKTDTNIEPHLITERFYFKTGATAALAAVRIQAWDGTDDTGPLIFDQTYPASEFPSNSDISLALEGFLEFEANASTFTRISSADTFSLKTDDTITNWFLAVDFSTVQDDDLLQTNEWIAGDNFIKGVWSTQDRKVYEANVTGIQVGVFTDNLEKWDQLISVQGFDRILNSIDGNSIADNNGNLVIGPV